MPPPTDAQVALIRRFEPILFFHPQERFFPSDAKRYLEQCALTVGAAPVIAAGKLAAIAGEAQAPSDFLGRKLPNGKFEFLEETAANPGNKDAFLDLAGWMPPTPQLPELKRYANLGAIAARYANASDPLNASQFWYHAEYFDKARLQSLFAAETAAGGKDFGKLIETPENPGVLKDPALICYYLFFPGHDEGLPGCEAVASAQEFASFAGEWACFALLLDQQGVGAPIMSLYAGLSMRNVGVADHLGEEVRVGLRIFPGGALPALNDHPRLMVARGSHALYLPGETPGTVKAFTPDDPGRNSCGLAEPVAAAMEGTENITAPPFLMPVGETAAHVTKILSGVTGGALIGLAFGPIGAAVGAVVGAIVVGAGWIAAETQPFKTGSSTSPSPAPTPGPVSDTVPTTEAGPAAGKVVHPATAVPPEATPDRGQAWRSDKITVAGRSYDYLVDRDAQIFWAGDPALPGYPGRWGPPVEADPQPRRAGMRFPKFWRMFMSELVASDPQFFINRLEGTPIGNATGGGGLAAAYDSDTNQTFAESPNSASTAGVYIGKRFPAPYRVSGISLFLSRDRGLSANSGVARVCTVYGRNGADPTTPTDGTPIFTFSITDAANGVFTFLKDFDVSNAYDRVWVTVPNPDGTNLAVFTEVNWFRNP